MLLATISRRLELPEDTDDLAQDSEARPFPDPDGGEGFVLGPEDHPLPVHLEALDRDLVIHHRHDDLTGESLRLNLDKHEIAIEDAGIPHAVTLDVQQEGLPASGPLPGERVACLDVLLGKERASGCDPAEQRRERGARLLAQLDSPRPPACAGEDPGPLQALEVVLDPPKVDLAVLGDLAQRRRSAMPGLVVRDEADDLSLPVRQSHRISLPPLPLHVVIAGIKVMDC